jgi:hypothetical protein
LKSILCPKKIKQVIQILSTKHLGLFLLLLALFLLMFKVGLAIDGPYIPFSKSADRRIAIMGGGSA